MKKIYNGLYEYRYIGIKYSLRECEILPEYLRAYYFDNDYHPDYLSKESHICLPMFYKYNLSEYSIIRMNVVI